MQKMFDQYYLTTELAKKYSHSTYLASPTSESEHQMVLTVFTSSLFHFPDEREKLLLKARGVKQLQYPYLVPILDMGIEQEQPFVVREYLPNGSLRSRLKKISPDHLGLREALTIVLRVGQVLAYAHEHQIFHGSIKPENVFFDANDQALLTDFHLVDRNDAVVRDQTAEEYAFCYMAPEQFTGSITEKSDQYSLGCLTYELITGHVPFAAQTLASMMGHQNSSQPLTLSESVADLPPSLEAAVLKALAKDPDERFYDFSLFLEVIQCVLSPSPAFPLVRSTRSRTNRDISHPSQSTKEESILSSIRNRAASRPRLSSVRKRVAPQPFEPFEDFSSTEAEIAESVVTPLTPQTSVSETVESIPLAGLLETASWPDRFTFPFSEDANPLSHKEQGLEELEHNEAPTFTLETMLQIASISGSKRRALRHALLLSVIVALVTSAFWAVGMFTLGGRLHPTQKMTRAVITGVEGTPGVQSSAQAIIVPVVLYPTPTSIAQPPIPIPTPTPAVVVTPSTSYEADAPNNTRDGTKLFSCNLCHDGFRVGWISYNIFLQFNDVNVNYDGNYTLTIYYLNSITNRQTSAFVSADGGPNVMVPGLQILTVNCCDNIPSQVTQMAISLRAGSNTIKISNPTGYAPDIDRIVVGHG